MNKIDLIIPCYNIEEYLPALFHSLDLQTLNKKYYNIIFINDGSTDKTFSLLEKYSNKKNNVILINKKNEGVGIARQTGMNSGDSEYVLFMDPDDFIHKKYLETWWKSIDGTDLTVSDWFLCSKKTKFGTKFPLIDKFKYFFIIGFGIFKVGPRIAGTQNKMWRKEAIKDIKWRSFKKAQDNVFYYECLSKIKTIKKIGRGTSYYYRDMRVGSVNDRAKTDTSLIKSDDEARRFSYKILKSTKSINPKINKLIKKEFLYRKKQLGE